ncbi:MAG: HNH endonuclease [Desulfobacterales bacterium]|nr:HNH endonuclease [Desulfobacterales bacterium]
MKVYVKSKSGQWLMPTHSAKARVLLKQGKATVIKRIPFTIQLLYDTTRYIQPVTVGIDDGGINIGISAVSNNKVLYQEGLIVRTDIKGKMDAKRQYRRSRHYRKTRYRKARWENRKHSIANCKVCGGNAPKSQVICRACLEKVEGIHQKYTTINKTAFRLPPSIKSKKDAIIDKIKGIPLPMNKIVLEDAYFDFQAMENPDITGEQYQQGELLYHKNYKQACLVRDGFKCRVCKAEKNLRCHHVTPKAKEGTDRLSNLMTLCETCHEKHHNEGLKLPKQKSSFYVFASHVQQGKNYLRQKLSEIASVATTFGYITNHYRRQAGMEKSHINDAVIIANKNAVPITDYIKTNHVSSRKRSLHEATARKGRKEPNQTQKRNNKNVFRVNGFRRWDSIIYKNQFGFISGFTGKSECYLVDIEGTYIKNPSKQYKQVSLKEVALIHHNQGFISQLVN